MELTAENADQIVATAKNGTLIFHLSATLRDANTSEEGRISFHIMFSSFTENLAKPLWRTQNA